MFIALTNISNIANRLLCHGQTWLTPHSPSMVTVDDQCPVVCN